MRSPHFFPIAGNLFISHPLPSGKGYTWTLASRAGEIRDLAESRYGQRDISFAFLGVEFSDAGPQIWFPGNRRHVIIQLNTSAINDEIRALYPLAHECVHLLDPQVLGDASVFEEGLAALFSAEYVRRLCPTYSPSDAKYDTAARLVKQALAISPNVVRDLRAQGTPFGKFTQQQIESSCPGLSPQDCRSLSAKFQAWNGFASDRGIDPAVS
jgi:hypothetical protein